uniref:Uncharacterized protein n=1 Tax=Arundo donax TaxID=35708 RepID=A0A0A9DA25_ARUDO
MHILFAFASAFCRASIQQTDSKSISPVFLIIKLKNRLLSILSSLILHESMQLVSKKHI